jgi:arylsulfatase A-like enzyme
MSDHGESFGDRGVYNHDWTAEPIDPLIRVPLLVKYPGGEHAGVTFDHQVQNADLLATLAELLDWSQEPPANTRPLTDPTTRPIISKSNTAIRVTTERGSAVRTDDGIDISGDVDDRSLEVLESSSIPNVSTLSGDVPGTSKREQRELEQRLEYLGYK